MNEFLEAEEQADAASDRVPQPLAAGGGVEIEASLDFHGAGKD